MRNNIDRNLGLFFILIGFAGMLHQRIFTSGGWFNWQQVWHHELFIVMAFAFGAGLLIGKLLRRRGIT